MHSITVVSNLLVAGTQRHIVFGPYGFESSCERLSWVEDFSQQLDRINRDHLHPYDGDIYVLFQRRFNTNAEPAPSVTAVTAGLLAVVAHGAVMELRAKAS